jgi:hypothetical protein
LNGNNYLLAKDTAFVIDNAGNSAGQENDKKNNESNRLGQSNRRGTSPDANQGFSSEHPEFSSGTYDNKTLR